MGNKNPRLIWGEHEALWKGVVVRIKIRNLHTFSELFSLNIVLGA